MNEFIKKLIERLEELEQGRLEMHDWQGQSAVSDAIEIVNQLAEEYKAHKGEWKFDISGAGHYNCSVCGGRGDFYGKYNYCPHCGSKMNDVEEAKAYNESVNGDLISRSALLKELESSEIQPTKDTDGFIDGWCEGFNTVVDMIRDTPTAYNGGWIPCSERLPDKFGAYLVSRKGCLRPEIELYNKKFEEWTCKDVVAWQPLPENFKPEGE